jgi:hypothetical protein
MTEPLTPFRDLAGLAVYDADNLRAGHVFGVLTEADTGLVRFLDVDLEGEMRHVLVPIGHARLEPGLAEPRFRLRAVRLDDLRNIPSYDGQDGWRDAQYAGRLAAEYGRYFRGAHYYAHPAFDHHGLFAGPHPIVAESAARPTAELLRLTTSNYRVASHEPDVLGWNVTDANHALIGTTVDLLFDPQSEQVCYALLELPGDGRRLLPIGYLEIDESRKALRLPGLMAADVRALPAATDEPPARAQEQDLLDAIERALDARNPFLRIDFSDREIRSQQRTS